MVPDSPAAKGGLQAGDIILKVDGTAIEFSADLPHLERILKDLDAVPCVIWVTPDAQDPGPTWWDGAAHDGSTLNERLALFEASLLKRLPKHPTVHHADWGELQLDEYYEADLLHPSPAGSLAFASYLSERIAALC